MVPSPHRYEIFLSYLVYTMVYQIYSVYLSYTVRVNTLPFDGGPLRSRDYKSIGERKTASYVSKVGERLMREAVYPSGSVVLRF